MGKRGFELVKNAPADTKLPTRKTKCSQGYDFYMPCDVHIMPYAYSQLIPLNIKAYMPDDEGLEIHIRSSIGLVHHISLANCVGLIDADYYNNPENDGNIGIVLHNHNNYGVTFQRGERIVQGVFRKYLTVDNDNTTEERKGASGSTGRF